MKFSSYEKFRCFKAIFVNGVKMFFIIEGVSGAGKSCLLNALQKLFVTHYPKATKLFISEHFTQRSLEHLPGEKVFLILPLKKV
ncbi:MAG: hypothetical protein C5B45_00515 [Chlamydiae bacterium]|nr:MAG: hypothetical protein C5B45_00515 [Chlamydiota bacterium]